MLYFESVIGQFWHKLSKLTEYHQTLAAILSAGWGRQSSPWWYWRPLLPQLKSSQSLWHIIVKRRACFASSCCRSSTCAWYRFTFLPCLVPGWAAWLLGPHSLFHASSQAMHPSESVFSHSLMSTSTTFLLSETYSEASKWSEQASQRSVNKHPRLGPPGPPPGVGDPPAPWRWNASLANVSNVRRHPTNLHRPLSVWISQIICITWRRWPPWLQQHCHPSHSHNSLCPRSLTRPRQCRLSKLINPNNRRSNKSWWCNSKWPPDRSWSEEVIS